MQDLQEAWYGADVDYDAGSPHLSHHALRRRLVGILRRTLRQLDAADLPLKVLEIGAGHGGSRPISTRASGMTSAGAIAACLRRAVATGGSAVAAPQQPRH